MRLERGLEVDMEGFEAAMDEQRSRGRAAASFSASLGQRIAVGSAVSFTGYEGTDGDANLVALYDMQGVEQPALDTGQQGVLILDETPFYAESGGQVGDCGVLTVGSARFRVDDTLVSGTQHMHIGEVVAGRFEPQARVHTQVDADRRDRIRRNHSATHLLHAALRRVLGEHVQQKGSLVSDEKLRFDFSHNQPISAEQLQAIEEMVNEQIRLNSAVQTELMGYDDAVAKGAMALFGEKYADEVRVLTMGGDYSVELCGGTHVQRTGDIGLFKITAEAGIAAGVRRIEAVTGAGALAEVRRADQLLDEISGLVKSNRGDLAERIQSLLADNRRLYKELDEAGQKLAASQGSDLAASAVDINGVKFLASQVQGDSKAMMQTLDTLRSQLGDSIIVLAQVEAGKIGLVVGVAKNLTGQVKAPEIMAVVGPAVGAKGGGRPDMARAGGGDNPDGLAQAFQAAEEFVRGQLSG